MPLQAWSSVTMLGIESQCPISAVLQPRRCPAPYILITLHMTFMCKYSKTGIGRSPVLVWSSIWRSHKEVQFCRLELSTDEVAQSLNFERAAAGKNFAIVISHVEPNSQCERVSNMIVIFANDCSSPYAILWERSASTHRGFHSESKICHLSIPPLGCQTRRRSCLHLRHPHYIDF